MQIGAQIYTVYNYVQTLESLSESLKKISDIGYKAVQISGTCPFEPEWLKDELLKNDLTCVLTHVAPNRLIEETQKVIDEHAILGCRHIGIGGMPNPMRGSLEGYKQFKKTFLPIAKQINDAGFKLMYHNHSFEFEKLGGKDVIERILEDFPKDTIDFTLDLGWAAFGGADVAELIRTLSGRISRIHLKDYENNKEVLERDGYPYLRPIYEGELDYDSYIAELKKSGCNYMLVEQDWTYGEDPFDCLKRSYDNVVSKFPEVK